jgi:tetratricopeptide (TPR) repeat protein
MAHYNLGIALHADRKLDKAVAAYRKAIALQPELAQAHINLGVVLEEQNKLIEAEAAYRESIELRPFATGYNNLGKVLRTQGKLRDAEAAYGKAIELRPEFAPAYRGLGLVLVDLARLPDAITAHRKAVELQPNIADAHFDLGVALQKADWQSTDAEKAYRKAIELNPQHAEAHNNFGTILAMRQKFAEAEALFRKAIELGANAHYGLGLALREQGHFADSVASLKRAQKLGTQNIQLLFSIQRGEEYVLLDAKLPRILNGEIQPKDAAERISLGKFCQLPCKQLYVAAARFYGEAFAAEPLLADNVNTGNRYNAAWAAALAGCAQGKDASHLEVNEMISLREQAFAWLRADLKIWQDRLTKDPTKQGSIVQQNMRHWQQNPDFAGVRDAAALAKLSEAEREDWRKLWQDVEELRQRAAESGRTPAGWSVR